MLTTVIPLATTAGGPMARAHMSGKMAAWLLLAAETAKVGLARRRFVEYRTSLHTRLVIFSLAMPADTVLKVGAVYTTTTNTSMTYVRLTTAG